MAAETLGQEKVYLEVPSEGGSGDQSPGKVLAVRTHSSIQR